MSPIATSKRSKSKETGAEIRYLRSLFEKLHVGFAVVNRRNQFIDGNRTFARLTGYSMRELLALSLTRLTPNKYRKEIKASQSALLESGKPQQCTIQLIQKKSQRVPVSIVRISSHEKDNWDYLIINDISARIEFEQQLKTHKEKYSQVYNSAVNGIITLNEKGIITSCNSAFEKIQGRRREDIVGRSYKEFLSPRDIPRAAMNIKKRIHGEHGVSEYEIFGKDGKKIQVEVISQKVKNADGTFEIFVRVRDISERKRLLNELRHSEGTYKVLVENAEEMMLIQDYPEGAILFANTKFKEMTGYKNNGKKKPELIDFIHSDDRQHYREIFLNLKNRSSTGQKFFFRIPTVEQGVRYVSANSVLLSGPQQKSQIISVLRDITEEKYLENRLKSSEERYRELFDNANDLIFIFDIDGHVIDCNKAAESITGYSRAELRTMSFDSLYSETVQSSVKSSQSRKLFPVGLKSPEEIEFIKKDGSVIKVEFSLTPMYDNDGPRASYQGVVRDISERKKLQDQLLQAEKLSSIGELISGVAHELNNPLSVVLGCSELISKAEDLPPHLKAKSRLIINGAVRCAKIVENLVSFARKKELYKEYINIHEVIDKTLDLHSYRFKVNNVTVVKDYSQSKVCTMADPIQLQQVFLNILNNAYDSILEMKRMGRIVVSTSIDKPFIRIEIADNGSGISPHIQNRIFDPFFSTKEVGKGTGLGLSVSYGIIKEHGGDLLLDKSCRKGAKFVILLPIFKSKTGIRSLDSIKEEKYIQKHKRLLIIDSDITILHMCEEILLDSGYIVETASKGSQALSLIKSTRYDGIVLDIMMPGEIGGKELFYQIKALYPDMAGSIILMVSDSTGQETQKFLQEQNVPFVAKPFHTKTLLNVINSNL